MTYSHDVARVLRYIKTSITDDIYSVDIASQLGMNESYVNKILQYLAKLEIIDYDDVAG
jgi:transcription initiation factor IIE alpha subunit